MPGTQTRRAAAAKRRLDFGDDDNHNDDDAKKTKVARTTTTREEAPALVIGTPEKKKRSRRDDSGDIASYFSSPGPKTRRTSATAALITPEPKAKAKTKATTTTSRHVPIYIHKNLNYQRRGEASLGEKRLAIFRMVEEHCGIPEEFENDRSYGPLSGTCFEERVIEAYDKGLLTAFSGVTICTHCASLGHDRDGCPELI